MVDLAIDLWTIMSLAVVVTIVCVVAWLMAADWRHDIDQDFSERLKRLRSSSEDD